jgi:hypothetical protein
MKRFLTALLLTFITISASILQSATGQGFHPPCASNLPFQLKTLKQSQPIDASCDLDGDGSDASRLQNKAKNNFCAPGASIRVTNNTFFRLEQRIETRLTQMNIKWGTPQQIPASRDMLGDVLTQGGVSLGEGSVVRYVAFVLDAHHSNLSGGEKVNCDKSGEKNNDIHISLGLDPNTIPCDSVTAEISPHFRPDSWNDFDQYWIYNPVRITGQLFFDASHKPCKPGHPVQPARISSWEIHPVYAIDVCKNSTLGGCPAGDDSKWIPFNVWVTIPDTEDDEP